MPKEVQAESRAKYGWRGQVASHTPLRVPRAHAALHKGLRALPLLLGACMPNPSFQGTVCKLRLHPAPELQRYTLNPH